MERQLIQSVDERLIFTYPDKSIDVVVRGIYKPEYSILEVNLGADQKPKLVKVPIDEVVELEDRVRVEYASENEIGASRSVHEGRFVYGFEPGCEVKSVIYKGNLCVDIQHGEAISFYQNGDLIDKMRVAVQVKPNYIIIENKSDGAFNMLHNGIWTQPMEDRPQIWVKYQDNHYHPPGRIALVFKAPKGIQILRSELGPPRK